MWIYYQSSGKLYRGPDYVDTGYAGTGVGKNSPAHEGLKSIGPLPVGYYSIEDPKDTLYHGPYVLPLTPDAGNEMHGRSGFLIHGDSKVNPGTASEGCIVLSHFTRQRIANSGDRRLEVRHQLHG